MRDTWGVVILAAAAAAMLTAWSFVVPIFEGPDEFLHWQYARFLHDQRRLPIYGPELAEGNSPPLYYAAIAPVAARTVTPPPGVWLDGRGLFAMPFLPRFFLGAADDWRHYWPIRQARLLTVLMSLVAVVVCARIGFEATGRAGTALLTAGLVAFLPQFTFRGSQVSNDALLTTMAACVVWGMVRIVRRGFTWRRGVLAAVALAAAWLTKINALCLVPAFALVILTEPAPWRKRLAWMSVFVVTLALVAPWSIRNVALYGDPFAIGAMPAAVPLLIVERSAFSDFWVTRFPREVFKTFVGYFGHATVKLPRALYIAWLALFVVAALGLAQRVRRGRRGRRAGDGERGEAVERDEAVERAEVSRRLLWVLLTTTVGAIVILVRINLQFDQPQGRYLFPALPAIALAIALGLEHWRIPPRLTIASLAIVNALILAMVVIPAYPPNVPTVSKAVATPHAHHASGDWSADVRIEANDARFVIFELEGRPLGAVAGSQNAVSREVRGEAVITLDSAPESATNSATNSATDSATDSATGVGRARHQDITLPFAWLNDGQRRTIYLTLLPQSPALARAPAGTVTRIRIRPGAAAAVERLRLAGSIPSHDF